jgi:HD superfamily phosphodiesterase
MKYSAVLAPPEIRHLLHGLAAGADQALFSPQDWAFRLGDEVAAHQFIGQMEKEWLPMTVPNEFCQQMLDFARDYLSWHPGWPHIWAHILRVTGYTLALAPEADIDPQIAFLLGIFHDVGKLDEFRSGDKHEEVGASLAQQKLKGTLKRSEVALIANVICKKASQQHPWSQVLYDADKLDKIGATGVARRLSTSRDERFTAVALRRVEDDLDDFPAMHFPLSKQLARDKVEFTSAFLSLFMIPDDGKTV